MHQRLEEHIFSFSLPLSTQMHLKMVNINPLPPFYSLTQTQASLQAKTGQQRQPLLLQKLRCY